MKFWRVLDDRIVAGRPSLFHDAGPATANTLHVPPKSVFKRGTSRSPCAAERSRGQRNISSINGFQNYQLSFRLQQGRLATVMHGWFQCRKSTNSFIGHGLMHGLVDADLGGGARLYTCRPNATEQTAAMARNNYAFFHS